MEREPNVLYRVLEEGFELDSPEAIAKWRESRKRNFPTTSNIQRKETDKANTVLRGEKFLPKRLNRKVYRYPIKEEKGRGGGSYRQHHNHSFHNPVPISSWVNRRIPENKSEVLLLESYYAAVEVDPNGILIRAKHTLWDPQLTQEILEDEGEDAGTLSTAGTSVASSISITDDEDEFLQTTPEVVEVKSIATNDNLGAGNFTPSCLSANSITKGSSLPIPIPVSALQALVAYGSDSDLEDGEIEEPEELPNIVPEGSAETSSSGVTPRPSPFPRNSGAGEHEQPVSDKSPVTSALPPFNKNYSRKRRRNRNKDNNLNGPPQHPTRSFLQKKRMKRSDREPTLLRRLLDDEICEERNAVLCGSRFLIQNNFLEGMERSQDVKVEFIDCIRSSSTLEEDQ